MSRRHILAGIALLLLTLAAALAVLPARWLMHALPSHLPLALVDASGTVWSGSATFAIGSGPNQRTLPQPLRWHWSFGSGPQMTITHPWLAGPLVLAPSLTGMQLSAQTLHLPAQALSAFDARIAAIDPDGRLSLTWPPLRLSRHGRPAGAPLLDAEWRDAASALTPIRPIGHYGLSLKQADDSNVDLTLRTVRGPLMLEGKGELSPDGRLRFDGIAQVDPAAGPGVHAALFDVLSALGPRQNDQTLLRHR